MKDCERPCPSCPFSRKSQRGETGKASVARYLGQISGPFFLPCHSGKAEDGTGYMEAGDRLRPGKFPQCAGAAIMRANIGASAKMPDSIHSLPEDREAVFSDMVEFCSHHSPAFRDPADKDRDAEVVAIADEVSSYLGRGMSGRDFLMGILESICINAEMRRAAMSMMVGDPRASVSPSFDKGKEEA